MKKGKKNPAPPRLLSASPAGGASCDTACSAGGVAACPSAGVTDPGAGSSGVAAPAAPGVAGRQAASPAGGVAGGGGAESGVADLAAADRAAGRAGVAGGGVIAGGVVGNGGGDGDVTVGGAGRFRDRDRKNLHFLRVYRLAIYPVLSRLFFGGPGKSCGHVAKRLSEAGLVEIHKRGFPGGVTWLCLTAKGARKAGLRDRHVLSGSSIAAYLQTLLFCVLSEIGKRRYLLEHDEVQKVTPKGVFPSNVHVVATEEFGEPVLLRCFHARGAVKSTVKAVQSLVEALEKKPGMREALLLGDVGVAVLCPTAEARDGVSRQIAASSLSEYRLVVEWAPDSGHLAGYLKKQKAETK